MSTESPTQIEAYKAITVHTKVKSVLRLLQGEHPDKVADELGVPAERLLRWKERFVEGGRASLLRRRTDDSVRAQRQRQKLVQWTLFVIGLMFAIWLITRVFAGMMQNSA
jgi:hypothetical protein